MKAFVDNPPKYKIGDTIVCKDGHWFEIKQIHISEFDKTSLRWMHAVEDNVPRYEYDYEGNSNQVIEHAILGKADEVVGKAYRDLKLQMENWKELAERIQSTMEEEFSDY